MKKQYKVIPLLVIKFETGSSVDSMRTTEAKYLGNVIVYTRYLNLHLFGLRFRLAEWLHYEIQSNN